MTENNGFDLKTELLRAAKKNDPAEIEKLLAGQPEALKKSLSRAVKANDMKRIKSLLS